MPSDVRRKKTRGNKGAGNHPPPPSSASPEVLQILSQQQSILTAMAQMLAAQQQGSRGIEPPPPPSQNPLPPPPPPGATHGNPPVVRGMSTPLLASPEGLTIPQFRDWKQRWEDYAKAQQLHIHPTATQHGILRSALDQEWTLLWNSGRISIAATDPVPDIIKALECYLRARRNPLLDRQQFYLRGQMSGESVDHYFAALKTLDDASAHELELHCHQCSAPCPTTCSGCQTAYPLDKQLQEIRLRDRLIYGLRDPEMQKRVLSEPFSTLSLQKVLNICTAVENSQATGASLASSSTSSPTVCAVKSTYKRQQTIHHHQQSMGSHSHSSSGQPAPATAAGCGYCGHFQRHPRSECRALDNTCTYCRRKGHYREMCYAEQRALPTNQRQNRGSRSPSPSNLHNWDSSSQQSHQPSASPASDINTIFGSASHQLLHITTGIGNSAHSVPWLPDSGSSMDIINEAQLQQLVPGAAITPTSRDVVAADGKSLGPVGSVKSTLSLNGRKYDTTLTVCKHSSTPVLSKEGCIALGLLPEGWPQPSSTPGTVHYRHPNHRGHLHDTGTGRGSRRSPLEGGHVGGSHVPIPTPPLHREG